MNPVLFYEKVSDKYNNSCHEKFYRMIARRLVSSISDDLKIKIILEIGAGTGFSTCELKNRYPDAEIIAVEPAASMLSIAKNKIDGIKWYPQPFSDFYLLKNPSLFFSSMSLHWLKPQEVHKLIKIAENSILAVALPANSKISGNLEKGNCLLKNAIFKLRAKNNWPKEIRSVEAFLNIIKSYFKNVYVEDFEITENFENVEVMSNILYERGVLMALFGDRTEIAKDYFDNLKNLKKISFKWHLKLIIAS